MEWALAAAFCAAAVVAFVRLPPCHPAQLWLIPWAAVLTLYALRLIPFVGLSATTVVLVAGGGGAFVLGTLAGDRLVRPRLRGGAGPERALPLAAALGATGTALMLLAFLGQVATQFGLRAALVSDANVRLAIGTGATVVTIKYIYLAFATAILAPMCAARTRGRRRVAWMAVAAAAVASQYFSTGRSNVLLAGILALVAYALARPVPPRRRTVLLAGVVTVVVTLPMFLAVGALLGKSYAESELGTFQNTFTEHEWTRPLALPYQYATTPIPALNEVVAVTGTFGRAGGCASLRLGCAALKRVGVPAEPDPQLSGYTGAPTPWNTYTALYAPLVDTGPYLALLVLLLEGLLVGAAWAWAASGALRGIAVYAGVSAAVAYSTVENNLLAPHLIGAGVLGIVLMLVAGRLAAAVPGRRAQGAVSRA
jgi:hypothetical protein